LHGYLYHLAYFILPAASITLELLQIRLVWLLVQKAFINHWIFQYIVGGFACIGGGLFGFDISSMSGVLSVSKTMQFFTRMQCNIILLSALFHQNNHYKDVFSNPGPNAQGAIVASMPAGSLVGALFVTWLGDKIGRKKTITLAGMIWVLGSILQCASVVSIIFSSRDNFSLKVPPPEPWHARSWPYHFRYFRRSLVCHRPDLSI
jgi:hypothetical protein